MVDEHGPRGSIRPPSSMIEVDDVGPKQHDEFETASITSSVLDYEYENGRRYHGYRAGSYPLPNDEREMDRIDLKHHVITLLCGGNLHLAPLLNPMRILDVGTGTGIWAMEMADQYPNSTVTGTDLSPVQPSWVPNNISFVIDDLESPLWSWQEDYFDYIHSRFMICSISSWPEFANKAFKHCKPGGYVELQELDPRFRSDDGSLSPDSYLSYWSDKICEAAELYNRPVPLYTEYRQWLEQAGFVDVKQTVFKSPTNSWPKNKQLKEVSAFQLLAHLDGLEGISMGLMTRGLQWKPEEVKVLLAKIRPELLDRSIHSYQTVIVLFGRKPDKQIVRRVSTGSAPPSSEAGPTPSDGAKEYSSVDHLECRGLITEDFGC